MKMDTRPAYCLHDYPADGLKGRNGIGNILWKGVGTDAGGVIQCSLTRGYYLQGPKPLACAMWILANERKAESVMSREENVRSILTSSEVSQLPVRDRVGLVIQHLQWVVETYGKNIGVRFQTRQCAQRNRESDTLDQAKSGTHASAKTLHPAHLL